jgi:hypothetical protein
MKNLFGNFLLYSPYKFTVFYDLNSILSVIMKKTQGGCDESAGRL